MAFHNFETAFLDISQTRFSRISSYQEYFDYLRRRWQVPESCSAIRSSWLRLIPRWAVETGREDKLPINSMTTRELSRYKIRHRCSLDLIPAKTILLIRAWLEQYHCMSCIVVAGSRQAEETSSLGCLSTHLGPKELRFSAYEEETIFYPELMISCPAIYVAVRLSAVSVPSSGTYLILDNPTRLEEWGGRPARLGYWSARHVAHCFKLASVE